MLSTAPEKSLIKLAFLGIRRDQISTGLHFFLHQKQVGLARQDNNMSHFNTRSLTGKTYNDLPMYNLEQILANLTEGN